LTRRYLLAVEGGGRVIVSRRKIGAIRLRQSHCRTRRNFVPEKPAHDEP
jgi:hypothetical protein